MQCHRFFVLPLVLLLSFSVVTPALAVHPTNPSIVYAGAADDGV